MNNSIKYTTLATYIAIASIGGIIGAKYTELKLAAGKQELQELGFDEPKSYASNKPELPEFYIDKGVY